MNVAFSSDIDGYENAAKLVGTGNINIGAEGAKRNTYTIVSDHCLVSKKWNSLEMRFLCLLLKLFFLYFRMHLAMVKQF